MNSERRIRRVANSIAASIAVAVLVAAVASGCGRTRDPELLVTGTVTDAQTETPIAGATVSDDGYGPEPYNAATTDSSGAYRYFTWHEEHGVVASAPGYKPQSKTLKTTFFHTEKEKVLDFDLEPERLTAPTSTD